ncbi:hypothetical protein PV325_013015, partial [Microctonus aethiopoides]
MLTEDNDPTKPPGVLDNAGSVSSSTEASVQHSRAISNGTYLMQMYMGHSMPTHPINVLCISDFAENWAFFSTHRNR